MKKTFIGIVAAIMLSSGVANAADEERFTFGLEVAPSVSWLTNGGHKNVESDGAKFKFAGGLVAYYNFGADNKYAVFSGINYNGYGGQMKGDILDSKNGKIGTTQVEYDFQELEIPLGLRFRTGSVGPVRFTAHANLGLGIVTTGHAEGHSIAENSTDGSLVGTFYDGKPSNYGPARLRGTFGLALGAEYDVDAAIITAKIRWRGGLTNTYFHKNGLTPVRTLDLSDELYDQCHGNYYSNRLHMRAHSIDFVVGVLF
jgi:hypothetical protein